MHRVEHDGKTSGDEVSDGNEIEQGGHKILVVLDRVNDVDVHFAKLLATDGTKVNHRILENLVRGE